MNVNFLDDVHKYIFDLKRRFVFRKNDIDRVLDMFECLYAVHEFQGLVDETVIRTQKLLGVQKCSFMLFNEQRKELFIKGQRGLDAAIADAAVVKLGEDIAGSVALRGRPVLVKNIEKDRQFRRQNRLSYRNASFISVPIICQGKTLGVINAAEKTDAEDDTFTGLDLRFLSLISRQVSFLMGARQESITDPLTGLLNFRHFTETLDREFQRSKRYSNSLCLIMIDVDDFKSYNDAFGHLEGDMLLKRIAHAITRSIRASDIACRYAGDEFIIILPETEVNQARVVTRKIAAAIDTIRSKRKVTISFGIAKQTLFMPNGQNLIAAADAALYQAKKDGKNRAFIHG